MVYFDVRKEERMIQNRKHLRIAVDLPVTLVTVLEVQEGSIVDLSEGGAQIVGASFPKGTRFQIDWHEQTLYARVMWDEIDRMGVRFEYPLKNGPLHDLLTAAQTPAESAPRPFLGPRLGHGQPQFGFGRRSAA